MLRTSLGPLALVAAMTLGACGDSVTLLDGPADIGSLSLLLTDAPGDFTEAVVTIERVELVGDDEESPVVVMDEAFTTDLLTLSNDIATLVDDATLAAGTYTQLRFIIPAACIGVEQADQSVAVYASDGFDACGPSDGTLMLPSFDQTGIKVNLPGGSIDVSGEQRILLVDFDVSQSFGQQAGMSGMWVMTPVINAEDVSLTGSIVVELAAADSVDLSDAGGSLADFSAQLGDESPVALADDDEDGVFTTRFLYVLPGEHQVSLGLNEDAGFDATLDPTSPRTVDLPGGQEVTVSFTVTSAQPAG